MIKLINNTNVGWGQYFKPTPKNIQKLSDAIVAFATIVSGSAVMADMKWLAFVFIVLGAIGTFGQKFFSNGN